MAKVLVVKLPIMIPYGKILNYLSKFHEDWGLSGEFQDIHRDKNPEGCKVYSKYTSFLSVVSVRLSLYYTAVVGRRKKRGN